MVDTEKNIFDRIKLDDMLAYEILFRKFYAALCNYAYKMVKDMDNAEEIIQDLFFNIWEKRHELVIETSVKSYLYKAAYNKSILFLRHKSVTEKYENYMKNTDVNTEPDAFDELSLKELNEVIDKTLDELPERSRKIFSLSRFEGLKYHEIAERLSLSVKTIEANMGRALKLFRKNIKTYFETTC